MCRITGNSLTMIIDVLLVLLLVFLVIKNSILVAIRSSKNIKSDILLVFSVVCLGFVFGMLLFLFNNISTSILYNADKCINKGCFDGYLVYNSIKYFIVILLGYGLVFKSFLAKYRKLKGKIKNNFLKKIVVYSALFFVLILIIYLNFINYGFLFDVGC